MGLAASLQKQGGLPPPPREVSPPPTQIQGGKIAPHTAPSYVPPAREHKPEELEELTSLKAGGSLHVPPAPRRLVP